MNKSTDINNMIISINNEYRKMLESVLQEYDNIDGEMVLDILSAWDAKVNEMSDTLVPIVGKVKKSRGSKGAKATGPKRPMSAYLFFCKEKRAEVKEENPNMKATEITTELGRMWKEVKETEDAEQYAELAKADKARYDAEMVDAPPKEPKEKKQRKRKVESDGENKEEKPKKKRAKKTAGPKKPMSAYLYFCQEKRGEVKAANPDMKPKEITSELGRLWNKIKETPKAIKYKEQAEDAKAQYAETAGAAKVQPEVENSNESDGEEERKEEAPKKSETKKGKKLPKAKEEKVPTTGYQLFCSEEGEGLEKKELRKRWFELKRTDTERFQDYEIRAKNKPVEEDTEEREEEAPERVILPQLSMNQTQEPESKAEPEEDLEDEAEVAEEEYEDPALVDARSLLNYLDEIKADRPNKEDFLEQVDSLENLSTEIKDYIGRVRKLRTGVISITAIEKLIVICKDTIKSYEL